MNLSKYTTGTGLLWTPKSITYESNFPKCSALLFLLIQHLYPMSLEHNALNTRNTAIHQALVHVSGVTTKYKPP